MCDTIHLDLSINLNSDAQDHHGSEGKEKQSFTYTGCVCVVTVLDFFWCRLPERRRAWRPVEGTYQTANPRWHAGDGVGPPEATHAGHVDREGERRPLRECAVGEGTAVARLTEGLSFFQLFFFENLFFSWYWFVDTFFRGGSWTHGPILEANARFAAPFEYIQNFSNEPLFGYNNTIAHDTI